MWRQVQADSVTSSFPAEVASRRFMSNPNKDSRDATDLSHDYVNEIWGSLIKQLLYYEH